MRCCVVATASDGVAVLEQISAAEFEKGLTPEEHAALFEAAKVRERAMKLEQEQSRVKVCVCSHARCGSNRYILCDWYI